MTNNSGTRDITYDLVSVLYHALQGAETYTMYMEDARNEGDNEAATFLQELINDETKRANQAKALLAKRLSQKTG